MAKQHKAIVIERRESSRDAHVWFDKFLVERVRGIAGVARVSSYDYMPNLHWIETDPRYSTQEVFAEIEALVIAETLLE